MFDALIAYTRLYLWCFVETLKVTAKNAWTLMLPLGLSLAFLAFALVLAPLGIVGGFILGFILAAAGSCYLYFVGEIVAKSKVTLAELKKSFAVYFWSIIGLGFVLWIFDIGLNWALAANPKREIIRGGLSLVLAVVLNPSPEVMYQRGTRGGVDTITTSFKFLQENWIEWFLPQVLVFGGAYLAGYQLQQLLMHPSIMLATSLSMNGVLFTLVLSLLLHLGMVYRGLLFQVLNGTSHRQRVFRFRRGTL